jgi:hypothetical protein
MTGQSRSATLGKLCGLLPGGCRSAGGPMRPRPGGAVHGRDRVATGLRSSEGRVSASTGLAAPRRHDQSHTFTTAVDRERLERLRDSLGWRSQGRPAMATAWSGLVSPIAGEQFGSLVGVIADVSGRGGQRAEARALARVDQRRLHSSRRSSRSAREAAVAACVRRGQHRIEQMAFGDLVCRNRR